MTRIKIRSGNRTGGSRGLAGFLAALAMAAWAGSAAASGHSIRASAAAARPDEILVRFASAPSADDVAREAQRLGLGQPTVETLRSALLSTTGVMVLGTLAPLQVQRLRVPPGRTSDAIARLAASPLVRYAEPNALRHALDYTTYTPLAQGPNDPFYQNRSQWWVAAIRADQAFAAHPPLSGTPVTIAILDTGIVLSHEDLAGRLVPGVDFTNPGGNGNDDDGHGTHVAGIAAAATNNLLGVAGTGFAATIRLMPVKVLAADGSGSDYDIAQGIIYAADQGCRVMNMSLGGSFAGQVLSDAVTYAYDRGCVLVAAGGNAALNGNPLSYPAAYPDVIAVAASDLNDAPAPYSDYGKYIALAAPGGTTLSPISADQIFSTLPDAVPLPENGTGTYGYDAGTSMASPMVAGAAAMLLAQEPGRTPVQVLTLLTTTTDKVGPIPYTQGWNPYLGWGRLNLYRALTAQSSYVPLTSGRASYNFPNPFRPGVGERTNIVLPYAPGETPPFIRLKIFDAIGRLVRSIETPPAQAFPGGTISWDGLNDRGQPAANGVYPYRLEIGDQRFSNKIVIAN